MKFKWVMCIHNSVVESSRRDVQLLRLGLKTLSPFALALLEHSCCLVKKSKGDYEWGKTAWRQRQAQLRCSILASDPSAPGQLPTHSSYVSGPRWDQQNFRVTYRISRNYKSFLKSQSTVDARDTSKHPTMHRTAHSPQKNYGPKCQ